MNKQRILWGGLAAGVLAFVLDGVSNAVIMGNQWKMAYDDLGRSMPSNAEIGMFWGVMSLVWGVLTVWLYAAVRPRLGAGPKTALMVGSVVWFFCHLVMFSHIMDGLYPTSLVVTISALELVSALAASYLGGWLYQEV